MRRLLFALCALSAPCFGQGMPPPTKVETWLSQHNQNRIQIAWEGPPEFKTTKLPDGSTEPPKAPWPFLLFVRGVDSKESQKIQATVFGDTRVALSAAVVRFVQITPDQAVDIPWLKATTGIKDPCLLVVDRDFKVLGLVNEWKNFDDRAVLPLLQKAADAVYPVKLATYVSEMVRLMQEGEKLWKDEVRVAELQRKASNADPVKQKALDEECDRIDKEVAAGLADIEKREDEAKSRMVASEPVAVALPETIGSGKTKRKLTPQELESIKTFREFSRNENPIVRAAAVEDLGAVDSPAMVDVILDACSDLDPRVVEAAGRALGKMKSDESLAALQAGLDHPNAKARTAATFGFAHVGRAWPSAVPKIVAILKGGEDDLRRAALQALANMRDPATIEPLLDALSDRVPALRVIAAEALGKLKVEKATLPLCAELTAEDWSLRKAAAEALGRIRSRDSIEPLIARMEAEDGLMIEVLFNALVAVTGEDHTLEAKYWRLWWTRAGERFKVPTDEEVAKAQLKAQESMAAYARPGKNAYHTIETLSRKMIFVIDISSSMGDKIPLPDDVTPAQIEAFGSRVKMDIAKNELIALIAGLGNDVQFNIITFSNSAEAWQDGLVGAAMKPTAIKFVSKLQAIQPPKSSGRAAGPVTGGEEQKTNTYGAILAAFGFADEGSPDWKKRSKADTIFFVTDGLPTTGQIVDVPKMIDTVTEMNRTRGLVLHVVVFDKVVAARLGGLAERNGGKCVVRTFGK